jgi:hypothetical protein
MLCVVVLTTDSLERVVHDQLHDVQFGRASSHTLGYAVHEISRVHVEHGHHLFKVPRHEQHVHVTSGHLPHGTCENVVLERFLF